MAVIDQRAFKLIFDRLFAARLSRSAQVVFRLYAALRPLRRPIFVIGAGRSGTRVFTHYLSMSSEIVNWTEANEMWDPVGFPWQADKVPRPFYPINPQGYTDSVVAQNGLAYFKAVPGMCAMYTAAHKGMFGHARFLNKSPMNALRVELIYSLFPDACFISLVRDPRAVVRSWAEKSGPKLNRHPRSGTEKAEDGSTVFIVNGVRYGWREMLERLSNSWCYVVKRQLEQLEVVPDEQRFSTSYEEFTSDLHGVLCEIDQKFFLDPEKRYWNQIPESLENRNAKFEKELSVSEIDLIGSECKIVMEQLGYEV